MSDLRTELFTKVVPKMSQLTKQTLDNLNFDDPDQPEETPATVDNTVVSIKEQVFDFVKAHPGCSCTEVSSELPHISNSTVMTTLYLLAERKLIHKTKSSVDHRLIYSAAVDAYPRADIKARMEKMRARREEIGAAEISRRISEGHKRNKAEAATSTLAKKIVLVKKPEQPAAPAVQVTPVDLNTLSIVQARKLYDELKQIFGA